MPVFQVELSDGRAFEIEADAAPSEADVLKALGAGGGTKPEKIGDAVESVPTAQLRAAAPVPVYQRAYRAVRETLSPLLGPTQEQMARDSVEWGGQRLYKPLGSEVDRSGFFPALSKPSVELPKFDTSQSEGLLPSAGKAVANTAMGFVDFATSPLGFATMAVGGPIAGTAGKAGKAIHRGVAGAFGADMLVKSPEAIVQAIDTARDPNATLGQKFEAGVGAGVNLALGGYLGAKGAGFPRARVNAEARGIERELGETPGNTGGTPAPLQLPERTGPIITPPPQPTFDKLRTTLGTVEEQLREAALLRDEGDFTTEARSARSPEGTQRREDAKAQVERAGRELVTPAEAPALTPVAESGVPADFNKWFGKSQAVDAFGHPKVLYHGTRKGGFNKFLSIAQRVDENNAAGKNIHGLGGVKLHNEQGAWSWFTESKDYAEVYTGKGQQINPGREGKSSDTPEMIEVLVKAEHPFVVTVPAETPVTIPEAARILGTSVKDMAYVAKLERIPNESEFNADFFSRMLFDDYASYKASLESVRSSNRSFNRTHLTERKPLYEFLRSRRVRDMLLAKGYDSIKTIEQGAVAWGVPDAEQIRVVRTSPVALTQPTAPTSGAGKEATQGREGAKAQAEFQPSSVGLRDSVVNPDPAQTFPAPPADALGQPGSMPGVAGAGSTSSSVGLRDSVVDQFPPTTQSEVSVAGEAAARRAESTTEARRARSQEGQGISDENAPSLWPSKPNHFQTDGVSKEIAGKVKHPTLPQGYGQRSWTMEKGRTQAEWFAVHPDGRHAIAIYQADRGQPYAAEILTHQTRAGLKSWEPLGGGREFSGTVEQVIQEIQRRNDYINQKEGAGKEATQRREEAKAQGTEPAALKQEVARAADPMAQQKSGFDPKAAKAQKKFLLDEIDKAIAEAPEQRAAVEADAEKAALESARAMNPGETRAQFLDRVDALTRRLAAKYDLKWPSGNTVLTAQEVALLKLAGRPTTRTSEGGMGRIDSAILDQAEKITIEVPGDGTFSIVNSRQALKDFKERAAKFPTTAPRAPKQGPGSPRVNPSAPAPLGKLDAKGAEAAAELMAGQDATRPSIQHLWSDGKQTVATDGRAIIVVDKGIGGTEKQPVMVKDGKAKKVKPGRMSSKESEDSYPNWRMVIPNEESLVTAAKGLDTGRLFTLVRQAQEATSEKQISVKLFRNPDGSIGVEAMAEDVGSYSGNVQEGAKVIGSYNPQYLLNILNAMRKVGSEKVDLRVTLEGGTEMNPIVIQGHGAKAVLMPMRMTDTRMGPDAGIPEGALTREDFEGGKVSREGAKGAKEPDIVSKLEAMKQAAGGETMATVIPGLDPATFRAMRNTALDVAIGAIKAGLAIREAAEAGWQNLKAALDKLGLKYDAAQLRAEFVQALTESDARVGLSARGTGILGDESLSAEMRSGVNPAYARRPQEEDAAFARRIVQSIGGPEAAAREWLAGNFRTEPEAVQTLLGIETQRQLANTERAARSRGDVAAADGIVTLQQALAEADMQRATDLGQGVAAFRMHYANWTPAAWVKDFREKVAGLAAERVDRARVEGRGSSVEGKTEATPTGIAQGVAEGVADKIEAEGNPKLAKTIREHWGKRPVGDTVERVPTTLEERLAKVGTKNPKATARKVQGFYEKEVRDWRRKHKIPEFDAETEREIIREANRIEQLPEDSIQRREAAIRLHDRIARMKGFEWWELPLDFWYANILSGFTTHARNILGNSVNLGAESALMMARNPSAIPQIIEALGRALPKSAREAGNVLRTGRDTAGREHASKFDAPGVLERVSNPVASKLLLPWKLVGRTLRAEDLAAFYPLQEARAAVLARHAAAKDGVPIWKRSQVARRILGWTAEAQARAVAKARGEGLAPGTLLFKRRVSELLENQRPEVLMRNAREFAFDGTFNNDPYGLIGAVADGIKNASVREPALKFVVPFTRIVANVSNSMLNWTPVGFWRAGRAKGYKLLLGKEANTGKLFGREVTDPQAIGDEFTRATVGTAALLGVAAAAAASIYDRDPKFAVTGGGPSDPDQKALLRQTGWIPYSVKVGDRYVSYQNTTAGLGLGIIGAYMDAVRYRNLDEQDALNRAAFALGSGFNVVLNSSFLSGLASLFNQASETGTKHPVKGVPATAIRTATSLAVPNFVKQVDQLFDPTRYSADDVRGMMLGQIPFARRNGQPDLNVFGEPVLSPLSKTFWSETQGDLLTRTLAGRRLWPSVPAESGLTADEHYEVMRLRGPLLRAALAERLGEITSLPRADAQAVVSQVSAEQTRAAMQALGLDSVAKVRREVQRGVRK